MGKLGPGEETKEVLARAVEKCGGEQRGGLE